MPEPLLPVVLMSIAGLAVNCVFAFFALGMDGLSFGPGASGPMEVMGAPRWVFFFVWELLFGITAMRSRAAGPVIVAALTVHLVAAFGFRDGVAALSDSYKTMYRRDEEWIIIGWLTGYGTMVVGLLVTGFVKWYRSRRPMRDV